MYKGEDSRAFDGLVPVKSKFEADIIRFSLCTFETFTYDEFRTFLAKRHNFNLDFEFKIYYNDPIDNDLLPISNDADFSRALSTTQHLLRLFLQRKGEGSDYVYALPKKRSKSKYLWRMSKSKIIFKSSSFRQISKMIDIDFLKPIVRVRFMKNESNKPLGLYIKEGRSYRLLPFSPDGVVEQVPGVFISRLVSGGLAESTGLLAINDEVLEVNGIEVLGKTLDQVYDMMLANSSNLVITIRPANQHAKKPLVDEKSLHDPQFCYGRSPDYKKGLEQNIIVEESGRVIIESWV